MDYMSIAHDLIVNMSGAFMLSVIGFFAIFVVSIITNSIDKNTRVTAEHNAKKLEFDHEIAKLVEQRKLIDTRVIEGSARRLGQDMRGTDLDRDRADRERNNG